MAIDILEEGLIVILFLLSDWQLLLPMTADIVAGVAKTDGNTWYNTAGTLQQKKFDQHIIEDIF